MYNILVCDDEKDIVSALRIYLESDGYAVYSANNGREALCEFLSISGKRAAEKADCNQKRFHYFHSL